MSNEKVTEVIKGKGKNLIILKFNTLQTPESIYIDDFSFKVKKWRPNPMLCYRCYNYGHTAKKCNNQPLCENCSRPNCRRTTCTNKTQCAHCGDSHFPTNKSCLRYIFEQEVICMADNEHIDRKSAFQRLC